LLLVVAAVVVVGAVVGAFLASGSPSPAAHERLVVRTLLRLPAASSVAELGGRAYVTDDLRDLLVAFDPATGRTLGSVHLNGRPVDVIAAGGEIWVANMVSNTIQEVSPGALRVVRTIAVPSGPSGLAAEGGRVWFSSIIAGSLGSLDPATGALGTVVPLAGGAVRLAAGFGALWVTGTTDALTEVRPRAGAGTPRLYSVTVGNGPIGLATGEGAVWVANASGHSVVRLDPASLRIEHTYTSVGGDPLVMAVAGGRVWVADGTGEGLRTIFPGSGLATVGLGAGPRALLGVGNDMWVATANPGRVLAVQVAGSNS
jgi:DNA-binding beta-propeller fold protein YncE